MKIEPEEEHEYLLITGNDPFLLTNQYLRLKTYITINAVCTFVVSIWAMRKMIISFRVRMRTHRDVIRAKDEGMIY